jgi:hypothetical protein
LELNELTEEARIELEDLGRVLKEEFTRNEILRRDSEVQWTEDLRQSKGKYDPEVYIKIPLSASKVYPKYTRGKETTFRGKLNSILLPDNDKNFSISPTPKPRLSSEVLKQITDMLHEVKKHKLMDVENVTEEDKKVTREELEEAIKQYAEARCKKMQKEIEDQIIDIDYDSVMRNVIKSTVGFGTGVVKGALSKKATDVSYQEKPDGSFEAVETKKHLPSIEFLRLWDWYPDMTSTDTEGCDFFWERYVMNKFQLRELADKESFYSDVIENFIKEHSKGNATYKQWELDIETLDNEKIKDTTRAGKYEVLCRIGSVDTEILRKVGLVDEKVKSPDVLCHLWLLGDKVIKFILNPVARNKIPYYVFYLDKDESSIYGKGLPRIIRDTQLTICGAMRATLNNAALTTGSQREVNLDLLWYDEDPEDSNPYKIWKRKGKGMEAQFPAIRPITYTSHIPELLTIIDKAMMLGDLEISVPLWLQSEKQNKESLDKFNSKLSSSTVSVKDIAKSFDKCNEGIICALYDWNMEFNKDDSIKGDFSVKAKGSFSLIMQELRYQSMVYFTQTLNDEERIYVKTGEFLREKAKMIDLNPDTYIRTEEEVAELKASQVDEEMNQLVKEEMMAKIQDRLAKAKNMEAKAEKTAKDSDLEVIESFTKPE